MATLINKSPKGKAPPPAPAPTVTEQESDDDDDNDLLDLAESITAVAHLLAPGNTNEQLALKAQAVVKASFDRALSSEQLSFPHLSTLLTSLSPSAAPTTRSASAAAADAPPTPLHLSLTPLAELTTEGMDPEMVWEQMEMRAGVVVGLLKEMFGGAGEESGDEGMGEEGGSEGSEEEEESGEEEGEEESSSESGEEEEEEEFEEEEPYFSKLGAEGVSAPGGEQDDEDDPEADATKSLTLATFDQPGSGRPSKRAPGPPSAVDDTFFSLHDFHVAADEGEFEMTKAMRGEAGNSDEEGSDDEFDLFKPISVGGGGEDSDAEEEEDLDGTGIMYADFFDPPAEPYGKGKPSKGKGKEEDRKGKKGKGKKDLPIPSTDKPVPAPPATKLKKRSVRFSDAVKVKTIAARGSEFDKLVAKFGWEMAEQMTEAKAAGEEMEDERVGGEGEEELAGGEGEEEESVFEEEEDIEMDDGEGSEEEEDEEEDSGEEESDDEEGRETIDRLKSSLFDEEDEEDDSSTPAASLSRHERRLLALSTQIASLEAENVGAKDWATKGEAKARDRPVNSLLEEDLEYERSGKVVPVITEETTKTIEDLIKKRILENNFDDVVRQRAIDPNAFLPSRFMEIQDVKSNKSLAEIYEEDYTTAKEKEAGREVTHELDKDLEKKHEEIEELFEELSGKLDALSNARFTPKPPKATITTISNVAAITMESALPTTASVSTLLAPEEVFVPDPTNEDRSDFTPSMKKTARQKRRKARAAMAKSAEKFSKGAKGEKERATKELVGTKGVTVIGKGGKVEGGKKRKRGDEDDGGRSGVSLKL